MTVLRSREILSTQTPKNAVAEPVTPPKTAEILSQSPKGTTSTIYCANKNSAIPEIGFDVVAGSIMVSESGSVRRLSARLAKNVMSGKRKTVEGTSISCDVRLGIDRSGKNKVLQDMCDRGVSELVEDNEEFKDSVGAAKLGFGCDIDACATETVDNGQCKRRCSMEVKALGNESSEKDMATKGFLSLRSGKKVMKRQINEDISIAGNSFQGIETSRESIPVFSVDVPVKSTSLANSSGPEEVAHDKNSSPSKTDPRTIGRLNVEGKRKMKLDAGESSSSGINTVKHEPENENGNSVSGIDHTVLAPDEIQVRDANLTVNDRRSAHMERFRNIARRNASRFAHFSSLDEISGHAHDVAGTESALPESSNVIEDWPGPFSTAMKIIKDRVANRNEERHGVSKDKSEAVDLKWIPESHGSCKHQKQVPSLQSLCLSILSKNADSITSLDFVPDALRHKICWFLCGSRKMDKHFLELLVRGTPTEVRIRDCSWLSEEAFDKIFEGCNTSKLMVLQLDQGGSCLPDYIVYSALARSPNSLPALTTISLKGAYRLSDSGLSMLASAAPSLKSIDISQCPLLTSEGICSLASPLRLVLRELYIDHCDGIDAMLILPALLELENLEVLSVAGILTVCDDFLTQLVSAHGSRIKELVLADCMELTDSSLKVIGDTCSDLQAIDLTNLCKLTDISIGHLANGCQVIQTLTLCRNAFSDEAIAAYLDVNGASLKCLSLNNVIQVSNHTALSLARNCKNLRSLDISWCRKLTNEALGLIVDSCLLLEMVKMFGCTQVNDVFLDRHSNPQVKLIGLKMTAVFNHIDVPDFLVGPLRYSSVCA